MIEALKNIFLNFFRLGLIQICSLALQLLLIPLVVSRAGIAENGKVLTALSVAGLFSILLNYGTSQSGPLALSEKSVATATALNRSPLSLLLTLRVLVFFLIAVLFMVLYWLRIPFAIFLLGALPMLVAEVLNPYIVCIGTNRLNVLVWLNFLGRATGFLLVYFYWFDPAGAFWVNAYVGAGLAIVFLLFWIVEFLQGRLRWEVASLADLRRLLKTNFSLVTSNLLVYLQQSLVLYTIGAVASVSVLGIYAIIDKLIWGLRMVLISFSGAVFASALDIYKEGQQRWLRFRSQINRLLAGGLLVVALVLLIMASPLADFLASGVDQRTLSMAIRLAAVIPLFTGLNLLNVLELILKKEFAALNRNNSWIFFMVCLLCFSLWSLFLLQVEILFWMPVLLLLLTESITLFVYEKNRHHPR